MPAPLNGANRRDAYPAPRILVAPPGYPKPAPCPYCGRSRRSTSAGDRFHATCRKAAARLDVGLIESVVMFR